jgi:toxin-antitoxin system PIN domain toxin
LFAADTNILLYAAIEQFAEHKKARRILQNWRESKEPWFITWNVVYEFVRVSTHASVLQRPLTLSSAVQFLVTIAENSNFSFLHETENHLSVLEDLKERYPRIAANLVQDFHTAVVLYEHGIRTLYTADTDFLQFDFLEVIDPVH